VGVVLSEEVHMIPGKLNPCGGCRYSGVLPKGRDSGPRKPKHGESMGPRPAHSK
jgi:hypothetical protein